LSATSGHWPESFEDHVCPVTPSAFQVLRFIALQKVMQDMPIRGWSGRGLLSKLASKCIGTNCEAEHEDEREKFQCDYCKSGEITP
jgi:hypothetical protein